MRIINFKYDSNIWPFSFSEDFINYLNFDIHGKTIFFEEDEIVLPVIVNLKFGFKIGYFVNPPLRNGKQMNVTDETAFFESLKKYLHQNSLIDFILPPLHIGVFTQVPPDAKGYELGIIKLDLLDKTEEEVFSGFKTNFRNLIRKATKDEVQIKFGLEYFDVFFKTYMEKQIREAVPFDSYDKIKVLLNRAKSDERITCAVAYHNGMVDAALLNVQSGGVAYYLFAGNTGEGHPGSSRLLQWEVIKLYLKMGVHSYQLGGVRMASMKNDKLVNIEFFKMGFGSYVENGFHFTWVIRPSKYRLYKLLMAIRSKIKRS